MFFNNLICNISSLRSLLNFPNSFFCYSSTSSIIDNSLYIVFFNGEDGIQADRVTGNDFLGLTYGPQYEVYYLILFWCIFAVAIMYLLTKTPFGRMCNAVRDNQQRAEFIGYDVRTIRWMAF